MSKRYFLWGGMYLNTTGIELVACAEPPGIRGTGWQPVEGMTPQWFRQTSWPDPPTDEVYARFPDYEPDHYSYLYKEYFSAEEAAEMRGFGQVPFEEEVSEEVLAAEAAELAATIARENARYAEHFGRRRRARPEDVALKKESNDRSDPDGE